MLFIETNEQLSTVITILQNSEKVSLLRTIVRHKMQLLYYFLHELPALPEFTCLHD